MSVSTNVFRWKVNVENKRTESTPYGVSRSDSKAPRISHWDLKPAKNAKLESETESCNSDMSNNSSDASKLPDGEIERYDLKFNVTLVILALICSLAYILFPVQNDGHTNYYSYYMGKAAFWAMFGIGAFVEQMEACLPGAPDTVYVYSYIIAFIAPPIVHLIVDFAYFPLTTNPSFNMFAVATSQISIMIIYGGWQYLETRSKEPVHDARVTIFDIITDHTTPEGDNDLKEIENAQSNPLLDGAVDTTISKHPTPGSRTGVTPTNTFPAVSALGGSKWMDIIPTYIRSQKLLPRYFNLNTDPPRKTRIIATNRAWHFILSCVYYLEWFLLSYLLIGVSAQFRNAVPDRKLMWFFVYSTICIIGRIAAKRTGLIIDAGKLGTCSLYLLAEFLGTLFYFVFYRMLFEDAITWPLFFIIQLMHFTTEWVMYGLRFSQTFFDVVDALPSRLESFKAILVMPGLNFEEWQILLVLEFVLRVWNALSSAVVFIVMFLTTLCCYWIKSSLKPVSSSQLHRVFYQISLCVLLEVVNAGVMFRVLRSHFVQSDTYFARYVSSFRFSIIAFFFSVCLYCSPFTACEEYVKVP